MTKKRNYVRERLNESPERKKRRLARGRARYALEKSGRVAKGDGKVVGHIKPLSKGGSNSKSNLRIESQSRSSKEGGKGGNRAGKARGGRKSKR